MQCCLCDDVAVFGAFGAQFCTDEHVQKFYDALLPKSRAKANDNVELHERAIHYAALNAKTSLKRRVTLTERYRDLKPIGQGSFGAVYRAENVKLNRVCALKIFSPDQPHESVKREYKHIFALRAELAELEMPHLLRNLPEIYDVFQADTPLYDRPAYVIEMEFIVGFNLADMAYGAAFERQFITVPQWIPLVHRVFLLLETMHDLDIAHCDIKPWNMMVRHSEGAWDFSNIHERVVMIDFGLACQGDDCAGVYSGTQVFMGPDMIGYPFDTAFMRWLDSLDPGVRMSQMQSEDVYAMATTMFNVISGQPLSLLQLRIQETMSRFGTNDIDPRDFATINEVNRQRREFCIARFTANRLEKSYRKLFDNPNFKSFDIELTRPLYEAITERTVQRPSAGSMVQRVASVARARRVNSD